MRLLAFVFVFILHIICCIVVTWWCGPGGIETWSGRPSHGWVIWPVKNCF